MIVTVANQKGGVGKTTTAVTLAHGAALQGMHVLLIDLDTQGNVADALGMDPGPDLYQWLIQAPPINRVAQIDVRPGLDVIRSDKMTAVLKIALSGMDFREMVLSQRLMGHQYDVVIFDNAPSVDVLHTSALVASDYLVIPTKLDQFAIKGVMEVTKSLAAVHQITRSGCMLAGIIPTFYDRVTTESHAQLTNMARSLGEHLWPPVPQDVACRVSNRKGQTLWEYAPNSRALIGYEAGGQTIGGYQAVLGRLLRLK